MSSLRKLLFLLLVLASEQTLAQSGRPNILLIVADDLGYTDLGSFGGEIPTPTLDALAYAGVRLTNFHTGQACQQTRAMLMTGRGASSVMQANPTRADGERANELRKDVATLPELLGDAGYRTYMAGKWDLGLTADVSPLARGFDRSFSLIEASSSHFAEYFWAEASYYQEDARRILLEDLPEDFYSTTAYTDKMLEYLQAHDTDTPWFGYMAYTAPHWPLQVPEPWLDRHEGAYDDGYDVLRTQRMQGATERGVIPEGTANIETFSPTAAPWDNLSLVMQERYVRAQEIYASMVELLDQEIGRLIDYLDDTDQLDNTIIFFMSDHGASAAEIGIIDGPSSMPPHFNTLIAQRDNSLENFGRPGSFVDHGRGFGEAATAPLRFYKGTLAEGGIRAAAFVHYPDQIEEGTINNTFATVMDLLPTFLDVANTSHPGTMYKGRRVQSVLGRSVWPNLTGESATVHGDDSSAGWTGGGASFDGPLGAIIKGRYKLTNQPSPVPRGAAATEWQLYDLEADPGETRNLAPTNPEIVDALLQEWQENWR